MLNKPKIGQPCNGCGICCRLQVCRNGAYILGLVKELGDTVPGPCPALWKNTDGSFSCGIVKQPKRFIRGSKYRDEVLGREFSILIGSGIGCDEIGYDEDPEEARKLDELYESTIADSEKMQRMEKAMKIIHGL